MANRSIQPSEIVIAYADDHAMVRRGISEFINGFEGCAVTIEANNGKELLQKLEFADKLPDICILDIFMPEMNGLETLIAINKKWQDIKVIVLTGHNTDFYLIQMLRSGAKGYLQKNCSPQELEQAIKSVYEFGIYNSEILTQKLFRELKNKYITAPDFTDNEIELLKHCCSDMSYDQIAREMQVTARSVDWYRSSLFKKLNVNSRSGLVMFAIQLGLINIDIDQTGHSIQNKN